MVMEMESTTNSSEVVIIDYSDLVEFCENNKLSSSSSSSKLIGLAIQQKNQVLIQKIEQAFGPYGLGIVVISNVPNVNEQRQKLLPLGAQIPYLPNINETLVDPISYYSVGWSHGKEQLSGGKCDYLKGSYYANPLTDDIVSSILQRDDGCCNNKEKETYLREQAKLHPEFYTANIWPDTTTLPEFKESFCQLGQTIVNVGCMVAKVCDAYCSNHVEYNNNNIDTTGITLNLANTIQQSLNCKGRLLHYFAPNSINDDESTTNTTTTENQSSSVSSTIETPMQQQTSENNLWCAWHNDHGSLTGLVPAMYLDHNGNEVPCPDNQTGLYIQPRQHNGITIDPIRVQVPTNFGISYILYQIGETSQIQSGGLLQATPHAVIFGNTTSSSNGTNRLVTRESFAVFMEPEFDTVLKSPTSTTLSALSPSTSPTLQFLPSLQQRWKPGQSFGDFHKATVSAFTTG